MAMLMAVRAAFSTEANGCETRRVSTERAVGLSLGPTDFPSIVMSEGRFRQRESFFVKISGKGKKTHV